MSKRLLFVWLFRLTCLAIIVAVFRQFYIDIVNFPNIFKGANIYEPFGISDWLINYQGGFVRRGLLGELLFQLYNWHPFPVVYIIIGISTTCLIGLTSLLVCLFRRMGWPVLLLLFPIFLYYRLYGLGFGILGSRRDTMMMLLAFLLFWQYKKYIVVGEVNKVIRVWLLSILILLLYEGVFFPIFPFLALHTVMHYRSSIYLMFKNLFFVWWPVAVLLIVIIIWHGNRETPELIWQSWIPMFRQYPYGYNLPDIGIGVSWLVGTINSNFNFAFNTTWLSEFGSYVPVWPFNIYVLLAVYYLFTRMDILVMNNHFQYERRIQVSNILTLQMIFVFPMLGIIANDWFRSIPYCCITSCFLCYLFPERFNVPKVIDDLSIKVQQLLSKSKFLCNPWVYYVVLISLPLGEMSARPGGMFPFIPLELKNRLLELLSY